MVLNKCPGSISTFTEIVEIKCPKCGAMVEFFSGDIAEKCECGENVLRIIKGNPCFFNCPAYESCRADLNEEIKQKIKEERKARGLK